MDRCEEAINLVAEDATNLVIEETNQTTNHRTYKCEENENKEGCNLPYT